MAADQRTARERQIRARLCQFVRADLRAFLKRLCVLVPRAQRMMLAYHGVLARVAGMRDLVVPMRPLPDDEKGADGAGGCDHSGQCERTRPQLPSATHGIGGSRTGLTAAAGATALVTEDRAT
ncbi:MAG: hypothetical protein ABL997_17085 [Planctomycetota bacterium]